jgi:predicted SAM-dependent methyltransferase
MKLNLGSGNRKMAGYTNIDIRGECDPDVILDVEKGFYFHDNEVDEIRAYDFLEHIHQDSVIYVMSEIHRVLKPEGILDFFIPSTEGNGAFMDPTHRSYWNLMTWLYFVSPEWHSLYPDWPLFKSIGQISRVITSKEMNIVHVTGKVTPIKGDE